MQANPCAQPTTIWTISKHQDLINKMVQHKRRERHAGIFVAPRFPMFRNKKWCNTRGQNTRRPDAQHAFWIPQRNAHEKVHRCMQICLFWIDQAKANNIRHVGPSQKQREHNFAKLVGPCAKEPLHNMNNIRHVGPCAEEPLHVFGCFVLSSFRLLPPSCAYPSQHLVARGYSS